MSKVSQLETISSLYYILESIRIRERFESAREPRGHGVTLRAFLSPLRHMEQLLLVTFCDSLAGIGDSLTPGWNLF